MRGGGGRCWMSISLKAAWDYRYKYLCGLHSCTLLFTMHKIYFDISNDASDQKFNAILIPRREIFYITYSFVILILGYKYTSYFLYHHFCLFKRGWCKFHSNLWVMIFCSKHTKVTDILGRSLAKLQRASKYFLIIWLT